jgi:integrase
MRLSANSRRAYAQAQRDFETSLKMPVENATAADLERYRELLAGKGLAASTIKLRVGVIANMSGTPFGFAAFPQNPKSGDFRGRSLTVEQVRRLLKAIPQEKMVDFAIIVTILLSGLRFADFREWAWTDFVLFGVTYVPVRGKNLVLNPSLVETLEMLRENDPRWVFAQRGKLPSLSAVKRHLQKYARLAGMEGKDVTLETLRRTSKQLSKKLTDLVSEALAERAAPVVRWKAKKDVRLHGIGRRGK